jgi:hypothetical protein
MTDEKVSIEELLKWIGRSASSLEEAETVGKLRSLVGKLAKRLRGKPWPSDSDS